MPGFDEIEFGSRRVVRRGPVDALFRRPSGTGRAPPGSGGDPGADSGRDGPGSGREPRSGDDSVERSPAGARRRKGSPKASRKEGSRKASRKKGSRKKRSGRKEPSGKRRPPPEGTDDRPAPRTTTATSDQDTTSEARSPVREDAILVPLDQWTKVMNQLGNLHEAGQQLAEARERAARAETEAVFLRERLREMRAELHSRGGSPPPDVVDR